MKSVWIKDNGFKIIAILFVGFCLLYYFVILPNKKFEYQVSQDVQQRKDAQANTQTNNLLRNSCLSSAQLNYSELWDSNGTKHSDSVYYVTDDIRDWLEKKLQNDKDDCYKQYPVNN